jgi:hypothetical protein
MITEHTVDADIYYRCLNRIGIFESSIGECEEILGEIAAGIETIVMNPDLSEEERRIKLEQIADNEVRRIQEINRLEEAEKDLFGFDLTEFTTAQAIRRAENPWLTQKNLQQLVIRYLKERVGEGTYIMGDATVKNLRLSVTARGRLRDDLRNLPGGGTEQRRVWESYLRGTKPNHPVTFDSDAAAKNRDSFFITTMHPLARQAAAQFAKDDPIYLCIQTNSDVIPAGTYPFSIYAWKYNGFHTHTKLVTVCGNDMLAAEFPDILETSMDYHGDKPADCDWSALEEKQVLMWQRERETHRRKIRSTIEYRLESLENMKRNKINSLKKKIREANDDSIRRMRTGELEAAQERYTQKAEEIREASRRADIYATLLVNGIITVLEG